MLSLTMLKMIARPPTNTPLIYKIERSSSLNKLIRVESVTYHDDDEDLPAQRAYFGILALEKEVDDLSHEEGHKEVTKLSAD